MLAQLQNDAPERCQACSAISRAVLCMAIHVRQDDNIMVLEEVLLQRFLEV